MNLMMSPKKRVTVLLDTETHLKLKIHAAQINVTMNDVMANAIEMYLQQNVEIDSH
tara:strand:- start:975 stop:1142 length:168 start_codon:yes stop_codon:yes gene_type:complete